MPASGVSSASTANIQIKKGAPSPRNLQIYPNPNKGEIVGVQLEGLTPQELLKIKLIDATGKEVYVQEEEANATGWLKTELLVQRQLARGLYMIQVEGKSDAIRSKLLMY